MSYFNLDETISKPFNQNLNRELELQVESDDTCGSVQRSLKNNKSNSLFERIRRRKMYNIS